MTEGGRHSLRLRAALAELADAAIDWLDHLDAAADGLEDEETEVVSEDDGTVDAVTLRQWG